MNFYKHHIGDYASATDHLSWDEDQAYTRLMRVYYRDERPLPIEIGKVVRLARAQTPAQRAAVEIVLNEFFTKESDGWHNKRCDVEINQANTQAEINRRIAADRETARLARITNGSLNGSSHGSLTNGSRSLAKSVNESTSVRQPIQTPDSRLHKPDSISQTRQGEGNGDARAKRSPRPGTRIPDDFQLTEERRAYAVSKLVNPEPTFEAFVAYWRAKPKNNTKLDWDLTWHSWVLKDAKDTQQRNAPRKTRYQEIMEMRDAGEK